MQKPGEGEWIQVCDSIQYSCTDFDQLVRVHFSNLGQNDLNCFAENVLKIYTASNSVVQF